MKILLVGNPNCGKTTLFNRLTHSRERVGNWHGVTVNAAVKKLPGGADIADLPGVYSLTEYASEEEETVKAVKGEGGSVIINVIEASMLSRSLRLTRELLVSGKPVAVVINMYEELCRRGGKINAEGLSELLGCPCVIINKFFGAEEMLALAEEAIGRKTEKSPKTHIIGDFGLKLPSDIYAPPKKKNSGADKFFLNPVFAVPVFLAAAAGVFYLTFGAYGPGVLLGESLKRFLFFIKELCIGFLCVKGAGKFVISLIGEGIFGGLIGVAGFIPQLAVLHACLIFLDESGYLPRAAFAIDGVFKKVGLSGKALFPLMSGFGCTATAIVAARSTESKSVKRNTVSAVYFIPCSARLPVFALLVSAFFEGKQFVAVSLIYVAGAAFGLIISAVSARLGGEKPEPLVTEIPPLRIPRFLSLLKQLNYYLKTFIIKIGTTLLAVSALVWLMRSVSPALEFLPAERISESILAKIGGALSFIFAPMGFKGWQMPVAALCGLVAKEGIVSALGIVYPSGLSGEFTAASALSFLVFAAYYTPCAMALSVTANEEGWRFCAFYGVFSFLFALLAGYLTYFAALITEKAGGWSVAIIPVIAVVVLLFAVKISDERRRKNDKIHCGFARKTCQTDIGAGRSVFRGEETSPRAGDKGERRTRKYRFNVRKRGLNRGLLRSRGERNAARSRI